MKIFSVLALSICAFNCRAQSPVTQIKEVTNKNYSALEGLYKDLHQHPELSSHEVNTSARVAKELQTLGFDVIEKIGGYGVVGILKNGKGPTVLIRTDMDALPLEEKTGLPYASTTKGINAVGAEVNVMHACGHDIHMTVFIGTAKAMAATKKYWKGTLVMVGQPAEETGAGAAMMFNDSLYAKIPTPTYAIALHNHASMAAGTIGYSTGNFMASADMMNITIHGKGGHGAAPHMTIDPIVLSAEMILAFQTIVSRETNPLEPAVITVGSIHGGTVHNIIPDDVKLQLTIRAYDPEVRKKLIASIENKAKYLALQAGVAEDKLPEITINDPKTPATINNKDLVTRLVKVFVEDFGQEKVIETPPSMVGEDFSRFGMQSRKVPIAMFWLGTIDPEKIKAYKQSGQPLPSLHSSSFAPQPEPTIKTGIIAMTSAAISLMQ